MVRLNINLDESHKAFIDQQIASGRYRNADEFFGEAVARARQGEEEVGIPLSDEEERLMAEALDDPAPPTEWNRETMDAMKREVIENHRKTTGR